jgi:hypothetical protein
MPRRNPVQERARAKVRRAVRAGTLIRPASCEQCGAVPKCVLAHHVTYSRPLDVLWLCPSCHLRAHPRPPRQPRPGSARSRAERELRRDPARSDALIAQAARCTPQAAGRWRRALERAGEIEHVEPAARASIPRTWRPRPPRLAIEQGATTPAEVMQLASVSYRTAWRALDRARSKEPNGVIPFGAARSVADAAAATDQISVVRIPAPAARRRWPASDPRPDRHAPAAIAPRPPPPWYADPDPIELACCTAEYADGGWQHERSCALRLASRR